jgi:serine/threonine-protein kinase RsbW
MKKSTLKKEFQVPSDLAEVQKASAKVLLVLKPLGLSEAFLFDIRLCLEEALINAMKYGNKLCKEVPVRLEIECDEAELRIRIEDQGEGFKLKTLKSCTEEENIWKFGGRGIYLIHQLMDKVAYNEKGNSLLMVKQLRNPLAASG